MRGGGQNSRIQGSASTLRCMGLVATVAAVAVNVTVSLLLPQGSHSRYACSTRVGIVISENFMINVLGSNALYKKYDSNQSNSESNDTG